MCETLTESVGKTHGHVSLCLVGITFYLCLVLCPLLGKECRASLNRGIKHSRASIFLYAHHCVGSVSTRVGNIVLSLFILFLLLLVPLQFGIEDRLSHRDSRVTSLLTARGTDVAHLLLMALFVVFLHLIVEALLHRLSHALGNDADSYLAP